MTAGLVPLGPKVPWLDSESIGDRSLAPSVRLAQRCARRARGKAVGSVDFGERDAPDEKASLILAARAIESIVAPGG